MLQGSAWQNKEDQAGGYDASWEATYSGEIGRASCRERGYALAW